MMSKRPVYDDGAAFGWPARNNLMNPQIPVRSGMEPHTHAWNSNR